jgi:hypothetical protein
MENSQPTEPERENKRGSWLSFLLVGSLSLVILAALVVLTMGYVGLVIGIGAGIFAVAAFHYVVWGWWLSKIIRDEEQAEAADLAERSDWPPGRPRP